MEIVLKRETFTDKSTIGILSIDGVFECFVLEDKDRGLDSKMTLTQINKIKVYGETAIPYGKYEVVVTMSNRFGKELPLLLDTPGYSGIRIHVGNKKEDTHGCLLPGTAKGIDTVIQSTIAFNKLFDKIKTAKKAGQKISITITK